MPGSIFILRPARAEDLDALLALEKRAIVELNYGCYPDDLLARAVQEIEMINLSLLEEGHFFALTDESDRILACGGWSQQVPAYAKARDSAHDAPMTGVAVVRSMFVDPVMARKGLGRRILNWIEADARRHGIRRLTLSATRMGEPLYRACGFTALAEDTFVLSDGRRLLGLEMEKVIAPCTRFHTSIAGAAA